MLDFLGVHFASVPPSRILRLRSRIMAPRPPFSSFLCLLYALVFLPAVLSAPTKASQANPAPTPTILGPQPPHFVAYTDQSQFGIPSAADLKASGVTYRV